MNTTIKTLPVTIGAIAKATGTSHDKLIELFFDTGYDYIMSYHTESSKRVEKHDLPHLESFTRMFLCSEVFWNWWKIEWQRTDAAFLHTESRSSTDYLRMQRLRVSVPSQRVIDQVIQLHQIKKKLQHA